MRVTIFEKLMPLHSNISLIKLDLNWNLALTTLNLDWKPVWSEWKQLWHKTVWLFLSYGLTPHPEKQLITDFTLKTDRLTFIQWDFKIWIISTQTTFKIKHFVWIQ